MACGAVDVKMIRRGPYTARSPVECDSTTAEANKRRLYAKYFNVHSANLVEMNKIRKWGLRRKTKRSARQKSNVLNRKLSHVQNCKINRRLHSNSSTANINGMISTLEPGIKRILRSKTKSLSKERSEIITENSQIKIKKEVDDIRIKLEDNQETVVFPPINPKFYKNMDFDKIIRGFFIKQSTSLSELQKLSFLRNLHIQRQIRKSNMRVIINGLKRNTTPSPESEMIDKESKPQSSSEEQSSTPVLKRKRGRVSNSAPFVGNDKIVLNEAKGSVINCLFINSLSILIVIQEKMVSFWKKNSTINFLPYIGTWLPAVKLLDRYPLSNYHMLPSNQNLTVINNDFYLFELWARFNHKYVELTTRFYFSWDGLIDSKSVQLENINLETSEVQYISLSRSFGIIVFWWDNVTNLMYYKFDSNSLEIGFKHCMQSSKEKITSIFDINDGGAMLLGSSHNQVIIWSLENTLIMSVINFNNSLTLITEINCVWVQCNGTYLYLIRENKSDFELISVNGSSNEWEIIQTFKKNEKQMFNCKNVHIDSGILMLNCVGKILLYELQTGNLLVEKTTGLSCTLGRNNVFIEVNNFHVSMANIFVRFLK